MAPDRGACTRPDYAVKENVRRWKPGEKSRCWDAIDGLSIRMKRDWIESSILCAVLAGCGSDSNPSGIAAPVGGASTAAPSSGGAGGAGPIQGGSDGQGSGGKSALPEVNFFDESRVSRVELRIDPTDWQTVLTEARAEVEKPTYVRASLTYDLATLNDVGVRAKGTIPVAATNQNKASLKLG